MLDKRQIVRSDTVRVAVIRLDHPARRERESGFSRTMRARPDPAA